MSKEFDLYLGALAELGDAGVTDKIIVKNLQVPIDAGVDVWGRAKKQPALVTVTLHLARPFDSAAAADSLDNSTVHYGKLTKDLQARITQQNDERHLTTAEAVDMISDAAATTATGAPIRAIEVDLMYPKGSMLGDGAGLLSVGIIAGSVRTCARVLYLRNVRIPCIVGVNSNERLQKQPVVVNLWVERILHHRSDSYPQLEAVLVNAISESSFETLESLSIMVVKELNEKYFRKEDEGTYIRLRVEKPMAVPFADAPCIEIMRLVSV